MVLTTPLLSCSAGCPEVSGEALLRNGTLAISAPNAALTTETAGLPSQSPSERFLTGVETV
jgi:hypothetical protein